jgi:hypothetical protein
MANLKISQAEPAGNALSRSERVAERHQLHRHSLADRLRDPKTLRAMAHSPRDRDAKERVTALLDDVYDLREELIAWADDRDGK